MHLINELNSTWSMYRYIQFILTTYKVWVGWHQHHTPTWISLWLFSPGINHSPVTVHWALIHLDRRPLWAEQTSWRRLQLRSQAAHTWICLKGVRPALRILVHHLQQVADCRLGGRACPLSNTFSRDDQADPLFPFLMKNRKSGDVLLTCEVPLSMCCHLLTGSAITSQSGQADCRSLAKVDFPTAGGWDHITQETYIAATHTQQSHESVIIIRLIWVIWTCHALTYVTLNRNPLDSSFSILTWCSTPCRGLTHPTCLAGHST